MYIFVLDALYRTPSICTSANQRRIYTSSYCFTSDQNIFMPATKDVYIHLSCTSPAASNVYIHPYKVSFYSSLVVGCIFLWLLSYIYKPLDIEITSNCNTNSQTYIYVHKKWDLLEQEGGKFGYQVRASKSHIIVKEKY